MPENSSTMSDDGVERGEASVNRPGNPARFLPPPQTPVQRLLRAVVIGLGVVLIVMLGAVAVGIVMKVGGKGTAPSPASSARFAMPEGATIEHMQVSGDRLILRLKTASGEEVDIVDTQTGRLISRIETPPPAVPHKTGP